MPPHPPCQCQRRASTPAALTLARTGFQTGLNPGAPFRPDAPILSPPPRQNEEGAGGWRAKPQLAKAVLHGEGESNHVPIPRAAPRAAFKSQRDFGPQPNGCEARATLGVLSATVSTPSGLWPRPASANGPGIVPHKIPSPEVGDSNHAYKCLQSPNPRGI